MSDPPFEIKHLSFYTLIIIALAWIKRREVKWLKISLPQSRKQSPRQKLKVKVQAQWVLSNQKWQQYKAEINACAISVFPPGVWITLHLTQTCADLQNTFSKHYSWKNKQCSVLCLCLSNPSLKSISLKSQHDSWSLWLVQYQMTTSK